MKNLALQINGFLNATYYMAVIWVLNASTEKCICNAAWRITEFADISRPKSGHSKRLIPKCNWPLPSKLMLCFQPRISALEAEITYCNYKKDLIFGFPVLDHSTRNRACRPVVRQRTQFLTLFLCHYNRLLKQNCFTCKTLQMHLTLHSRIPHLPM